MLFNTRYFLQALEGGETALDSLYAKISADKRHYGIQLIAKTSIKQRSWPQWSMALVNPGLANQHTIQKYCGSQDFMPMQLSADLARGLLNDLALTAEVR